MLNSIVLRSLKMEEVDNSETKISFKSTKKRQVRKRQNSSDSDEGNSVQEYNKEEYEKTRELQKLR